MESDREYWIAGGEDLERARAFIAERETGFALMNETAAKHGGKPVHNGRGIVGLTFDGSAPDGWIRKGYVSGKAYFMPKRDSAARKAIAKELASVRINDASGFHSLFSKTGGVMKAAGSGVAIHYIVWDWAGDQILLSVPTGSDFQPTGSTPLKMSEYWALKEQAKAA